MKKVLSAVLALAMVFSLSCTAFAVEEVPYEPVATETNIVPKSRPVSFVHLFGFRFQKDFQRNILHFW